MRTENDLRTAFTALERHAPAAARVLPGARSHSSQGLRSPRTIRWVAGIAATAALAGVVTALTLPSGTSNTNQNGGVASGIPIAKTELRAKLLAAFSAASDDIVYEYSTIKQPTGDRPLVQKTWISPWQVRAGQRTHARQLSLIGGKPQWDIEGSFPTSTPGIPPMNGKSKVININYENRTWSSQTLPAISYTSSIYFGTVDQPASILSAIKSKAWTIVGDTTLDGRAAIELFRTDPGGPVRLWVDAHSYLPLHLEFGNSAKSAPGFTQMDFEFLPPTQANLARLAAPIPSGFRHVTPQTPAAAPTQTPLFFG